MLTNAEYAHLNKVPVELPPDFEGFAAFTIELSDGSDMWRVAPQDTVSVSKMRKLQAREAAKDKAARLDMYIARGYAFESPSDGGDDNDE
jgi:hypothetical protein